MIEELKNDDLVRKVGGKFKLTALIQRRWLQLLQGERPLVDAEGLTDMEVIIKEIMEGQIEAVYPETPEEDDDER
jgi:DNA-directed RNA polymerase subunit omega